jgi:hypothetical protein
MQMFIDPYLVYAAFGDHHRPPFAAAKLLLIPVEMHPTRLKSCIQVSCASIEDNMPPKATRRAPRAPKASAQAPAEETPAFAQCGCWTVAQTLI